MAFNEEQFIRDMLGATGGKVTIEKGTLNKSFDEMKEDLENVFKPRESLFTLTAEEVEASNLLYKIADRVLDQKIKESMFDDNLDSGISALKLKSVCQKLLIRIKQWQDENTRTD